MTTELPSPIRSLDAQRLQRYIRWAAPPNFVSSGVLVALWFYFPSTLLLVMSAAVFANGLIGVIVYRLAGAGHQRAATTWLGAGLWAVSIGVSLGGIPFFSITLMCALLPVAAAVPYVSLQRLLGMGIAATLIVGIGATLTVLGATLSVDPVPVEAMNWVVAGGITVLVSIFGLSMWQNRSTLAQEVDRMLEANAELRESERTLEARFHRRTEQLEQAEQELADARDRAVEANEEKSAFLSSMSHELRTPLNAIIGFSEVLVEGTFGELNDKQREYAGDIHDSGKHLLSLINDILDLSRIESGQLELEVAGFELAVTVDNALVLMKERAMRRGVALVREIAPDVGLVVADELKIKQVVINLLTNAVKFTKAGGTVTVRAAATANDFTVWVTDTGVGISPEEQAAIFEDYQQASGVHVREQEGTGLGLALSRRLVELHGGRLEVESEVGAGSTFRLIIPFEADAVPAPSED